MKTLAAALIQSVLTALYWWLATTVSFGLFGGSRDPRLPPVSERTLLLQSYGTIVVAITLHAMLLTAWWRIKPRRA